MCGKNNWLITSGVLCSLIQSVLWMGFGLTGVLVYLCVIPVSPYEDDNDFFRVTFVKLYFEGPQCIPNGTYLGKFNTDYRSSIDLFTPDRVFGLMVAYVILNAVYFILSVLFYNNRKKQEKRKIALGWSSMTVVLCAIDFLFTFVMVRDIFTLRDYMSSPEPTDVYTSSAKGTLTEIPYIPLVLALLSSRFIAFWLWNFLVGVIVFIDVLCYRNIKEKALQPENRTVEKRNEFMEELRNETKNRANSISLANEKHHSAFDVQSNQNYLNCKESMETVTRFNTDSEKLISHRENGQRNWSYTPTEDHWHPVKSHSSREWEIAEEGHASKILSATEPEKGHDFDHNLENFESGQSKIKIVKPPIGKPVSIPIPPPLLASGSCSC